MSDIRMRGPEGCANTLHWGGQTYTADKRGEFTIPEAAKDDLLRHGFVVVRETLHLKREADK